MVTGFPAVLDFVAGGAGQESSESTMGSRVAGTRGKAPYRLHPTRRRAVEARAVVGQMRAATQLQRAVAGRGPVLRWWGLRDMKVRVSLDLE